MTMILQAIGSSARIFVGPYLHTKGIRCLPSQVIITAGATQAIAMLSRFLLKPGDVVFIEDPSATFIQHIFASTGADIILFDPLHNIIKRSACFWSRLFFAITEGNHDRDGKVSVLQQPFLVQQLIHFLNVKAFDRT
jgi:hypothetical protein